MLANYKDNRDVTKGCVRSKSGAVLVRGRLSYPDLLAPGKDNKGNPTKPGATLLIEPDYDLRMLEDWLQEAWLAKYGPDQKKWPKGPSVRTPEDCIRDAAEKAGSTGYEAGWRFITARVAKIEQLPELVDGTQAHRPPVTDEREVYAGRWATMSVNVFGYNNVTQGVSIGLNNVSLGKHDSVFGGAPSRAATDYDGIAAETASSDESAMD
jgi:hypothetical protein